MKSDAQRSADVSNRFSGAYRRYVVGVLLAIYALNFLDRLIINILAEPIKTDLKLADWQLGLITGLGFAVVYAIIGVYMGRLADRGNRKWLIAISLVVWSGFTALSAFTHNVFELFAARVGVGVGEAGSSPPSQSLIAEITPREKRSTVFSIYALGAPIGGTLGLVFGGFVVGAYGWRAAFLIAGLPGLAFAAIAALTLREPRSEHGAPRPAASRQTTFLEALHALAVKRTFWLIAVGGVIKAGLAAAVATFVASFFFRAHRAELATLAHGYGMAPTAFYGLTFGILQGVMGVTGTISGGRLGDRFGAKDGTGYVTVPAISALLAIPVMYFSLLLHSFYPALASMAMVYFLNGANLGPLAAANLGLVEERMRGTASAVFTLCTNTVGIAVGPVSIGGLSDLLSVHFGMGKTEGIRWALILANTLAFGAVAAFWAARKTIKEDLVAQ